MQTVRRLSPANQPVHAILLAGTLPLALGALLADWAYFDTQTIQWINFAAWLTAGTAVFTGLALLWAAGAAIFGAAPDRQGVIYLLLVLVMFGLAVLNALVHTRDGWGTMPDGLVLSGLIALLSVAATFVGFAQPRSGDRP